MFLIGTGPSELHAHMALDRRLHQLHPHNTPQTSILATSTHDGHWSVIATTSPEHPDKHQ